MTANKKHVRIKLTELKSHTRQEELFGDLPDHEFNRLLEDIRENGLEQPIEVLPDGTIISGHQRVRAAEELDWSEIDVIVRNDLDGAGPEAVEKHLIESNLNRRHLSPLDIARTYKRLKQLAQRSDFIHLRERGDLRDQLAIRFHLSGRTLDRYIRLLDAPRAVQDAFSAGMLSLKLATAVIFLPAANQKKIANAIIEGIDPKTIVSELVYGKQRTSRSEDEQLAMCAIAVADSVRRLQKRIDNKSITKQTFASLVSRLNVTRRQLSKIISECKKDI